MSQSNMHTVAGGHVVTAQLHDGSWMATYPNFIATGATENAALASLAERMTKAARDVANLATNEIPIPKTVRYIGERVELTRDCELGEKGERATVREISGHYMTLTFHRGPDVDVHTGADYEYLRTRPDPTPLSDDEKRILRHATKRSI